MTQEKTVAFSRISDSPTFPLKASHAVLKEDSGKPRPIPVSSEGGTQHIPFSMYPYVPESDFMLPRWRTLESTWGGQGVVLSELTWLVSNVWSLNPMRALNQDTCFSHMNQGEINSFPRLLSHWWLWAWSLHLHHCEAFDAVWVPSALGEVTLDSTAHPSHLFCSSFIYFSLADMKISENMEMFTIFYRSFQ